MIKLWNVIAHSQPVQTLLGPIVAPFERWGERRRAAQLAELYALRARVDDLRAGSTT